MEQSALTAAVAGGYAQWSWDRWSIALVVCTGVLAVASALCGMLGVRNAGVVVSLVPRLSMYLNGQADGATSAVTGSLKTLNLRAAPPLASGVAAALLRRSKVRRGTLLWWSPVAVLAAVAAVRRPDPDLLVALTVMFPGLGLLLVADRAYDIRSNRADHIVERAAHALGLVRALEHGQSKAPARHTAAARLPLAIRRLCRELKREAGRGATPTAGHLTAQLRYSARQALGASAAGERERERERLKLVLASVLARHSGPGAAGGRPVDPEVIDEAAVAAMAPRPRDGAGWVVGGGLLVLFCVCAFSFLAAQARVPADAQHLVAPTIAALGGYWLRSRRITEVGAAAPSSDCAESGSATAG